jgi:hypothetical protein
MIIERTSRRKPDSGPSDAIGMTPCPTARPQVPYCFCRVSLVRRIMGCAARSGSRERSAAGKRPWPDGRSCPRLADVRVSEGCSILCGTLRRYSAHVERRCPDRLRPRMERGADGSRSESLRSRPGCYWWTARAPLDEPHFSSVGCRLSGPTSTRSAVHSCRFHEVTSRASRLSAHLANRPTSREPRSPASPTRSRVKAASDERQRQGAREWPDRQGTSASRSRG